MSAMRPERGKHTHMAGTIPEPRSYQTILGDMIDAFLSRFGLRGLKTGGPLLSILESAAQSDLRGTQDIFNLLDATDVDRASGIALDRKALDEDTFRLPISASSGAVDVSDTSFTKISSKIYPGAAAPNAGTSVIKVADASAFPATGSLYIGRDTVNFEGPISYTLVAAVGTYWDITLAVPTQKFHDVNESVVLAQGGDRVVPAGTVVRTAVGNVGDSVTYSTINVATIRDGETFVAGVDVLCDQPGVIGNVPRGAISDFPSPPFVGASVINPQPFDNGKPAEDDPTLRERIKAIRQSRSRGTPLALITNAKGVVAPDENKSVVSASVFAAQGDPAVLFIDDGTGYEEINVGVPLESLLDQALGGEQYFKLTGGSLPVSKAFALSTISAPFALVSGAKLAAKVAGVLSEHSFSISEFRSIGNATAFEVVAAINGNPNLKFSARTSANGTKVVLFSRSELNEDIEVVAPDLGIDANTYLGFPSGINYTLRLYKNDQLLFKDGKSAIVVTAPQTNWNPTIASGVYVKVKVDGTPAAVYKIVSQDFVNAGTGYATVSASNSLDSWAAVFNSRIPGITCSVASGRLQFVSNRSTSSVAAIVISEPSGSDKDTDGVVVVDATNNLIQKGMFTSAVGLTASGRSNDYTLNRNTGELKLTSPLAANDWLSAGTIYTRAYLQSTEHALGTVTLTGTGNLYFVVDGAAALVTTGVTSGTTFDLTAPAGSRRRYATNPLTTVFQNVKAGDWMILWDPAFTVKGAWRVSFVDPAFQYVEVERETVHADQLGVAPSSNGIVFVRSVGNVQGVTVANGVNRSLSSIASELTVNLEGATTSVFRNKYLRVTTDTFGSNGDVFLATADIEGQKLLLPRNRLAINTSSHLAAEEAINQESGTPTFDVGTITALPGTLGTQSTVTGLTYTVGDLAFWGRRAVTATGGWANHANQWTAIKAVSGATADLRKTMSGATVGDIVFATSPYSIGYEDNLNVILDNLATVKNYNIPLWRRIKPVAGQSYTATNLQVVDVDNSNNPLSTAFGSTNAQFFQDFALYMKARGKSHASSGGSAPANYHFNKAILWRYSRMGPEGNKVKVQYINPIGPDLPISLTTANGSVADLMISLPSDAARGGLNLFDTTRFTTAITPGVPADTVVFAYSAPSVTLQRVANVVTGTTASAHGYAPGDVVFITSGDVNFPSGAKTLVTASGTTFTYNESAANAGPSAPQVVSSASSAPNFASVVVGDIVSIGTGTSFHSSALGAWRVSAKTATTFTILRLPGSQTANATPVLLNSAANIQFYPIKTADSSASDVVAWVNANIPTIATATAVENGGGAPGTGVIDMSTQDEFLRAFGNSTGGTAVQSWPLADGVNYILDSNLGAVPNTVTMKAAVASDLVTNSDFDNEEMRLVPIMVEGLYRFLSAPAVSGFYAGSSIAASTANSKLQLGSTTVGAAGSVQVTGGSGNAVGAPILGAGGVVNSTFSKVAIATSTAKGLIGDQWCAVQGSTSQSKVVPITSASSLTTIAANASNWTVTFDGGTVLWSRRQVINDTADKWHINKIGNFAFYMLIDGGGANLLNGAIEEGDWVKIHLNGATPANTGTFRLVRKYSNVGFWVENKDAVSETVQVVSNDFVEFYPYDSVMPGDSFVIDTTAFGQLNRGVFTVVDNTSVSSNQVVVSGSMQAFAGGGVLGATSTFLRFLEAAPIRLIKRIHTIGRSPASADNSDVVFTTAQLATKMSSGVGASIQPLNKLGFGTDLISGADSYTYAAGLIGEVNKVIYGDPTNPSVYPGVVAAGALVNISGPLVKRVSVGLAIRVRGTAVDVVDRVKSAVASAINRVGIGEAVAISNIVSAAQSVEGVVAVTVLSPTYSSGNDLIPVQANEKPRVLDLDQDILVSVVGQ